MHIFQASLVKGDKEMSLQSIFIIMVFSASNADNWIKKVQNLFRLNIN